MNVLFCSAQKIYRQNVGCMWRRKEAEGKGEEGVVLWMTSSETVKNCYRSGGRG